MSNERVAVRYAQAYIDVLKEKDALADAAVFLEFCKLVEGNAELTALFSDVTVSNDGKDRVVRELGSQLKLSTWTVNFLSVVALAGRLNCLSLVGQSVSNRLDVLNNIKTVTLTTSTSTSEADLELFRSSMKKTLGSNIRIDAQIDPSLLGGAIARVGSVVYDGSVRAQLSRLRAQLVKEN